MGSIRRIRKLRLNQRGKWGGVRIRSHLEVYRDRQDGANKNNLVNVEIMKNRPKALKTSNTRFVLVNARSIKNKDLMLHQHLIEKEIDICIVTETWLVQTDIDKIWYESTVLNRNQFQLFPSNRQGQRGGGIALVTKTNITTKLLDEGQLNTFQFDKWQLALKHTSITVIAIYHPPPSNLMRVTNGEFLDEFTDWVAESVSTCNNVILVGDFNLHVNNPNDDDACNFMETTQVLGLYQNITFPTDVTGNTLDLIFSEANNKIKVEECIQGDYISDHCLITYILGFNKPITTRKENKYSKVKSVNVLNMASDIRKGFIDPSTKSTSLEDKVMQFESILKSSLDNHAPIKTKLMPLQKPIPWFTEEVKIHVKK